MTASVVLDMLAGALVGARQLVQGTIASDARNLTIEKAG